MALTLPEIETLRKSLAALPAGAMTGLTPSAALEVLGELAAVTTERNRLRSELAELANLEELLTRGHLFGESPSAET